MSYQARFEPGNYETHLLKKLEANQELDFARGFTGNGPHREDFSVTYDGHEATETASRGEIRTTVLALKILELQHPRRCERPQADIAARRRLQRARRLAPQAAHRLHRAYQSFITTTDADIVVQNFTETCNVIPLGTD